MSKDFCLGKMINNYSHDDDGTPDSDLLEVSNVREFVKRRINESTRLLSLFNQGNLTSVDLREHRQTIKDDAGGDLI